PNSAPLAYLPGSEIRRGHDHRERARPIHDRGKQHRVQSWPIHNDALSTPGADVIEPAYPTIMLIPHQPISQAIIDTASNPAPSTRSPPPDHPTASAVPLHKHMASLQNHERRLRSSVHPATPGFGLRLWRVVAGIRSRRRTNNAWQRREAESVR